MDESHAILKRNLRCQHFASSADDDNEAKRKVSMPNFNTDLIFTSAVDVALTWATQPVTSNAQ